MIVLSPSLSSILNHNLTSYWNTSYILTIYDKTFEKHVPLR